MGLFDTAAPVFDFVRDALLSGLPGAAQIAIFAILSAIATMGLYVLFSRQDAIEEAKQSAKTARKELAEYDGEPEGLAPVALHSVKASGKHLGLTLWPAFLASIPILFVLGWLAVTYSYHPPKPGEALTLHVHPDEAELIATGLSPVEGKAGTYTLLWSAEGAELFDGEANAIATLPGDLTFPVVHQRGWFNIFFGNPLGYIPEGNAVEAVEFELTAIDYLELGPGWLGGWEMIYFMLLIAGSLTIKFVFKVN